MDEGYIKYSCEWENKYIQIPQETLLELNHWRDKLFDLGLIGMYSNGIGYGNLSTRNHSDTFYVSGSATGGKNTLKEEDYSIVNDWDIKTNTLQCAGRTKASSESLSHAASYEANAQIKAVIHIHSAALWAKYKGVLPTSSDKAAYGTPEIAIEIKNLVRSSADKTTGIIIMGGHEEGILSYAESLQEAGELLLLRATNS